MRHISFSLHLDFNLTPTSATLMEDTYLQSKRSRTAPTQTFSCCLIPACSKSSGLQLCCHNREIPGQAQRTGIWEEAKMEGKLFCLLRGNTFSLSAISV